MIITAKSDIIANDIDIAMKHIIEHKMCMNMNGNDNVENNRILDEQIELFRHSYEIFKK
jgi:hypothetical protein